VSKRAVRIKFWDGGVIGGWTCAIQIDGTTYPVNRIVGDGTGAGVSVSFDTQVQARTAAIAEARRIMRQSLG
jgi:hypothetical protein